MSFKKAEKSKKKKGKKKLGVQNGVQKGDQKGVQNGVQKGVQKGVPEGVQKGVQMGVQIGGFTFCTHPSRKTKGRKHATVGINKNAHWKNLVPCDPPPPCTHLGSTLVLSPFTTMVSTMHKTLPSMGKSTQQLQYLVSVFTNMT